MPPIERARRLTRFLQARFRIDLFSALVERDFERQLADVILEAERDAYRRGREAALADLRGGAGGSGASGSCASDRPAADGIGMQGERGRAVNRRSGDDPRLGAAGQPTTM